MLSIPSISIDSSDDLGAEGERGQDRQLVRGVEPADVESGIGFGIAEPLRLAQHIGEFRPLGGHLGEDEIAGAVENAEHPADAVARQAFTQRLDDRDGAGDRRLEGECDLRPVGQPRQIEPVMGDQRLVGGDHRLCRP